MSDNDYRADIEKAYEDLSAILDENGESLLNKIKLMHESKEKFNNARIESLEEENDRYKRELENLDETIEDLKYEDIRKINEIEHSENIKSKLKQKFRNMLGEKAELHDLFISISISKGKLEKKRDKLKEVIENVHEICAYSRHTNIDNLRRKIRQTVDEHIKYCEKCDEPKYRCHCESNKV